MIAAVSLSVKDICYGMSDFSIEMRFLLLVVTMSIWFLLVLLIKDGVFRFYVGDIGLIELKQSLDIIIERRDIKGLEGRDDVGDMVYLLIV